LVKFPYLPNSIFFIIFVKGKQIKKKHEIDQR